MSRVYLAGPHTDDAYRAEAKAHLAALGVDVLDPMAERDFRGKEIEHEDIIVLGDLADVVACGVILGNFTVPGWGTGMETWFGHSIHRPIVAYVDPSGRVSPWVAHVAGGYANVHRDLRAACEHVARLAA
jgi:hypothetical protein